ncbi:NERD domain-containing protein [Mycoplasma sp. Pen4]|uniref:nuclease-related domain-containing protein n=1 Tax=Mycoplasma sp. Pen4 TaxID=640330 RepID=UPI0016547D1C|nr:nuclease-related domain-containing protein [Mycoplasma sp. Pen4]QNM93388.1 NERD domain-containing protein [Mycoplasma sp. Pen4]
MDEKLIDTNHQTNTIITITVISIIWAVILFVYIYHKVINVNTKNKIGFKFENYLNNQINELVKKTEFSFVKGGVYRINNKMYELDSMLISNSLVVVIEYKYYLGKLEGDAASDELLLSSNKRKRKTIFNPIVQNEKHLNHVLKIIGKNVPIASVIVFPNELSIKIENKPDHVLLVLENKVSKCIEMLNEQAKALPQSIKKSDIVNAFDIYKIATSKEKIQFKKNIKNKNRR